MKNIIFIIYYEYNDYNSGDNGYEVYAFESIEGANKKLEEMYKSKVTDAFTEQEQEEFEHYYRTEKGWELRDKHGYSNSCYILETELRK